MAFFAALIVAVLYEERVLTARFGEAYRAGTEQGSALAWNTAATRFASAMLVKPLQDAATKDRRSNYAALIRRVENRPLPPAGTGPGRNTS